MAEPIRLPTTLEGAHRMIRALLNERAEDTQDPPPSVSEAAVSPLEEHQEHRWIKPTLLRRLETVTAERDTLAAELAEVRAHGWHADRIEAA